MFHSSSTVAFLLQNVTLHFILFFVLLVFVNIAAKMQLLKRTRENTVSMNSHFNLREKQKENRVALLSNHYGLILRPRFKKSLDLQVSFLVGLFEENKYVSSLCYVLY